MTTPLSESSVISGLASALEKSMVSRTIRYMQSFTHGLSSGDDSGLKNYWDEYCVQVQDQDSTFKDHYEQLIETFLTAQVAKLAPEQLAALWSQTDEGIDWRFEEEADRVPNPVNSTDVVEHIRRQVESAAGDWSNARIRRFMNSHGWDE